MISSEAKTHIDQTLSEIREDGFWKEERVISSAQGSHVRLSEKGDVINLCSNNYLGLANHPSVIEAAHKALEKWGFGMASVRFICGTQDIHKELEERISRFLGMEDTILYASCFDANGGLFETLLGKDDAIISDALNHASIIDGIRLCKAQRFRFASSDMVDLETQLIAADKAGAKTKMIATDGVFSMDGTIANLPAICDLAEKYGAMVMMDECHATGFVGEKGRGSHEHHDVMGRVDIITGTLGKALGGASGGFTSASKRVVELLRQRSRTYLFSNSIAPPIVAASIKVFEMLESSESETLRKHLWDNTRFFREGMKRAGFDLHPSETPIIPVMLYEAPLAQEMSKRLLDQGIYVIAFSFPVVAKGKARIRTQLTAAHTEDELQRVIDAFVRVKAGLE